MSELGPVVKLILKSDDTEYKLAEAKDRGYLSHVLVEVDGSYLYPVFFYTIGRLKFELEMSAQHGQPYIAEVGMIIVEEITLEAMGSVVHQLYTEGYFNYFVPLSRTKIAEADPFDWPP